ncbi:MAG TPA: hypothetical protein PLP28_10770, partial [Flavobacteriales bacterium]|nr:hypothetical protein [Flavobacteriales bacterium]
MSTVSRPARITVLFAPFLVLAGLVFSNRSSAQDTLYFTNGDILTGHAEEVGPDKVRFRIPDPGDPSGPAVEADGKGGALVTADRRDLVRLRLAGGQTISFNAAREVAAPDKAFLERKQAVTIDILAPALDHFTAGYQRSVKKGIILRADLGWIGLGVSRRDNVYGNEIRYRQGGLLRLGVAFMLPRRPARTPNVRRDHPLNGWYLRPDVALSGWTEQRTRYTHTGPYMLETRSSTDLLSVAVTTVFGRQIMIGRRC